MEESGTEKTKTCIAAARSAASSREITAARALTKVRKELDELEEEISCASRSDRETRLSLKRAVSPKKIQSRKRQPTQAQQDSAVVVHRRLSK